MKVVILTLDIKSSLYESQTKVVYLWTIASCNIKWYFIFMPMKKERHLFNASYICMFIDANKSCMKLLSPISHFNISSFLFRCQGGEVNRPADCWRVYCEDLSNKSNNQVSIIQERIFINSRKIINNKTYGKHFVWKHHGCFDLDRTIRDFSPFSQMIESSRAGLGNCNREKYVASCFLKENVHTFWKPGSVILQNLLLP